MPPVARRSRRGIYEPLSARVISRRAFAARLLGHFAVVTAIVGVSLLVGMIGYVWLAGMSWVDAFMNASMLLGGMGPANDLPNDASKIFAGIYALYAGLVFIVSAGVIVTPVAHRILHRIHADEE
jgi:hypothetical protein